ncbi:MAG: His/Gly/Thr/Pro-type tRNA ligase C-terminal domain-containing protein [Chloroflexi bacterium]|nr:His/Gly/Thr/Pro-type tRNA ligase C-terminal domain-containing protein [Chloroflexota bacterium]
MMIERPAPASSFNDADLIGLPWRVTVGGRGLAQGTVEVKRRNQAARESVPLVELVSFLQADVNLRN